MQCSGLPGAHKEYPIGIHLRQKVVCVACKAGAKAVLEPLERFESEMEAEKGRPGSVTTRQFSPLVTDKRRKKPLSMERKPANSAAHPRL